MVATLVPVYPLCGKESDWDPLKTPEVYFTDNFLLQLLRRNNSSAASMFGPIPEVGYTIHLHGGATLTPTTERATYSNPTGLKVDGLVTVRWCWPETDEDHVKGECTWKLLTDADSHCEHLDSKLGVIKARWPD